MWPFSSRKYTTLSKAVRAGNKRAVKKMLDKGFDPDKRDPDDSAHPIHYALHHGPEMVQILVDHGADVNIPSQKNHSTPLAFVESMGLMDVASILRKAGGRLHTDDEEFTMDPRLRLQIERQLRELVVLARIQFHTESPEAVAERLEEKVNFEFLEDMQPADQERTRMEVRALIRKECGLKDHLDAIENTAPSPKESKNHIADRKRTQIEAEIEAAVKTTGMTVNGLAREFLIDLIKQGENPFDEAPKWILDEAKQKYPDILFLAKKKFGVIK